MAPVIELEGVLHEFVSDDGRHVLALDGVAFAIGRHEFVVVIGPSGCGKSTILRLIGGLLKPTSGLIAINGRRVVEPSDEIGIVFQRPTLLPWLNVLANVTFPMKHKYGFVDDKARERAGALLRLMGLGDFAGKQPDELSGGMQQRVAIARSLFHDPEILLMDEPFSSLDALTRDEMSLELLRIYHERPKTIVFVTHSISEAILLADRIIVMTPRPGRIRDIIKVPLARPRGLETLADPIFNELANGIRHKVLTRSNLG
jgi:NitT/TauT family transport system ATP-binding protein